MFGNKKLLQKTDDQELIRFDGGSICSEICMDMCANTATPIYGSDASYNK